MKQLNINGALKHTDYRYYDNKRVNYGVFLYECFNAFISSFQ